MHDRWSTGSSSIKSWHNHRQCAQTTRRSSAGLPSSKSSQSMESIRVDPQIWYIRDHETWIWAALLWNAWASKGTWGVGPQSTLELQKPGMSPLQKCILPIRFLRFLSLKHQGLWQVHRTIVSQDGVDLFGDDSYTCMAAWSKNHPGLNGGLYPIRLQTILGRIFSDLPHTSPRTLDSLNFWPFPMHFLLERTQANGCKAGCCHCSQHWRNDLRFQLSSESCDGLPETLPSKYTNVLCVKILESLWII